MPAQSPDQPKRPYLRPAERRRQLLDSAAAVVRRDGLAGLTMVAVTAEAGVSRRLVYNHFPDLPTLVRSYVVDRLGSFMQASTAPVTDSPTDPVRIAQENLARFREVAPEDRALLRALLSGTASKELIPLQTLVEQAVVDRWRRMHPTAPEDPLVRPRTLLVAQLGLALADLLDRNVVDLDQARHLIAELSAVLPRTAS